MKIYLVHHGEAVPDEQDPRRPLTARGRADAAAVACWAVERAGARVGCVRHSEKLRAAQTAQAWREVLPSAQLIPDPRLNPSADPAALAADLAGEEQDLVLVGHQPFLGRLAAVLVCGDVDRPVLALPAAGAACLERGPHGGWSVRWVVGPDLL